MVTDFIQACLSCQTSFDELASTKQSTITSKAREKTQQHKVLLWQSLKKMTLQEWPSV